MLGNKKVNSNVKIGQALVRLGQFGDKMETKPI